MVSCGSFSGVVFNGGNVPAEIGTATMTFGIAFGLTKAKRNAVVERCLEATADYEQVVRDRIQPRVANALFSRIEGVRTRIESALALAKPRSVVVEEISGPSI